MSDMSSAEIRKIRKPLVERKRRERINDSLNVLKALLLQATNKDEAQYSKMEKADILEMAVDFFKIARHQNPSTIMRQHEVMRQYHSGYQRCIQEVNRAMVALPGSRPEVHQRLIEHLHRGSMGVPGFAGRPIAPAASFVAPSVGHVSPPVAHVTPMSRGFESRQAPVRPVAIPARHANVDENNNCVGSAIPNLNLQRRVDDESASHHQQNVDDNNNTMDVNQPDRTPTGGVGLANLDHREVSLPSSQEVPSHFFNPIEIQVNNLDSSFAKSTYSLGNTSPSQDSEASLDMLRNSPVSRKLDFEESCGQSLAKEEEKLNHSFNLAKMHMVSCGSSVWRPW